MTDKEKLAIYDQLREMHKYLYELDRTKFEGQDHNAIDAVECVLYLAEGHFARMSD